MCIVGKLSRLQLPGQANTTLTQYTASGRLYLNKETTHNSLIAVELTVTAP